MVWVTKFVSHSTEYWKGSQKHIFVAIRVVLYEHYFYISHSKKLKEKYS